MQKLHSLEPPVWHLTTLSDCHYPPLLLPIPFLPILFSSIWSFFPPFFLYYVRFSYLWAAFTRLFKRFFSSSVSAHYLAYSTLLFFQKYSFLTLIFRRISFSSSIILLTTFFFPISFLLIQLYFSTQYVSF